MQIVNAAPIMLLIALSGCTEKVEASDPPAIETASEMNADVPTASHSENEEQREPGMQKPVAYD